MLQNLGAGEDLSGRAHQILQQIEFAGGQFHTVFAAAHLPGDAIEFQLADFEEVMPFVGCAE
jgi:hypothetical protein